MRTALYRPVRQFSCPYHSPIRALALALVLVLFAPLASADDLWVTDFKVAKEKAAKE